MLFRRIGKLSIALVCNELTTAQQLKVKTMNSTKRWNSVSILTCEPMKEPYAFIVLNRPILFEAHHFQRIWNKATIRVLVDGGANQWFKFIEENKLDGAIERPHFLTGDMDSISDESSERLKIMNCQLIPTPDQDETDCTKSLIAIQSHLETQQIKNAFFLTDFGGRIDQTMSQINTLFKRPIPDAINVFLWSHQTLAWLLQPGQHEILVPIDFVAKEFWCSYIPMNGQTIVTTNGLKWDLTNTSVGFGGIISSSNTYKNSTIKIHCDKHLLWSMGTCKS